MLHPDTQVALQATRRNALAALTPPPRLSLGEWMEAQMRLPEGVSATPGRVRLWPYQRGIADAISDPTTERVTIVKPVRVGFSTLLTGALASYVANEPSPILLLLPTEADCRDYMVSDVEPIFEATPALSGLLSAEADETGRNTLLSRRFAGGSLKIVAAKAPRNLRRHNVRVLLMDEVDGMETTAEGSPLILAEKRTLSFANRKIILGSTPTIEETSNVLRSYRLSDQRIFEVPCPECGAFTEIQWNHIEWEPDRPETAAFRCPHCESLVSERHKAGMVAQGVWRITRPEVTYAAPVRIAAEDMIHVFEPAGPGAVRGVSPLASVLLTLSELDGAEDALLTQTKIAALLSVLLTNENELSGDDPFQDGQSLEPGAMIRLPGNWKVNAIAPQQTQQAGEFLRHLTHRIASGVGVPVWLVTSDVSQANYSSLRAALVSFRQRIERYQFQTLAPQFLTPVWRRVATMAALEHGLPVDDDLFAVEWIAPAQPWVDPAKDASAVIEQMKAGLMSRRQAVASLGYSIEDLDREIMADRKREAEMGLTFAKGSKPGGTDEKI